MTKLSIVLMVLMREDSVQLLINARDSCARTIPDALGMQENLETINTAKELNNHVETLVKFGPMILGGTKCVMVT